MGDSVSEEKGSFLAFAAFWQRGWSYWVAVGNRTGDILQRDSLQRGTEK